MQTLDETLKQITALFARKQFSEVVSACEVAERNGTDRKLLVKNWVYALAMIGRFAEALTMIEGALAVNPANYALVNLKGIVFKSAGNFSEAQIWFQRAVKISPNQLPANANLGRLNSVRGNLPEAIRYFRRAVKIAPADPEMLRLLGHTYLSAGENAESVKVMRRLMWVAPKVTAAWSVSVIALMNLGKFDEAHKVAEQARNKLPESTLADVLIARIKLRDGKTDAAICALRKVQEKEPGELESGLILSRLLLTKDSREALEILERTQAKHPDDESVKRALVFAYGAARHGDEAEFLEKAYGLAAHLAERYPQERLKYANENRAIFARMLDLDCFDETGSLDELLPYWQTNGELHYAHYELGRVKTLQDRLRIVDWHRSWGKVIEAMIKPLPPVSSPAVHRPRKIRIGIMSSDLRDHPVGYFALPLVEFYDRDRFELYCYSFSTAPRDRAQEFIEEKSTAFRWWPSCTDQQAADGIAKDELDILFELGGTTAMNKLNVMAYRPARIGASWLGYPHSSGLSRIDYILMDPHTLPSDPRLLIEKPFMMPETWIAMSRRSFGNVAIEEDLPEMRQGALTFGTANNPYKFTRECFDTWAAVLRRVENSRFLFLRPEAGTVTFQTNAAKHFGERGIDPSRLDFVNVRGNHKVHYNAIDIALDSLPHVGGTTTCESLWMGVPTISLAGPGFCERLAHSNLINAGVPELSAPTVEAYIDIATDLAEDKAKRSHLRHNLRQMIRANPIGQEQRFAQAFCDRAAQVAS